MPKGAATEAEKEHLIDLTVDLVLELRSQFLAAGANAIKHWDQLTDRVRGATRTCAGPEEWFTKIHRDLKIASPSRGAALASERLTEAVRRYGVRAWLALVEREYAFVIAKARRISEERREARETAAMSGKTEE